MKSIAVFDSQGEQYEDAFKVFLRHTDQKRKASEWLNRLLFTLKNRTTFIDVGAGTGIVTAQLEGHFRRTIAIEPNPALFDGLKETCPNAELLPQPILDVKLEPIGDLVLCSHVLYYVDENQWLDTLGKLASWVSKDGAAVVILQNPQTDCMNILRHFYQRAYDLPAVVNQLRQVAGREYEISLETVPSYVETNDLQSAYRIAVFMLNLMPSKQPPSEMLVKAYVRQHFCTPSGQYRFSCHQDFLTIRKK